MRHLVIGQRQKAPNFSAFHWSPHCCLITIGQHFVTTRVVHLPKRAETSLITESDQCRSNHQLLRLCTVRTAWSDSDQAVRAVHSCSSWLSKRTSKVIKTSKSRSTVSPRGSLPGNSLLFFFVPMRQYFSGTRKFCLAHGLMQLTRDTKVTSFVYKRHLRSVTKTFS